MPLEGGVAELKRLEVVIGELEKDRRRR